MDAWGRFVFRYRWLVLAGSLTLAITGFLLLAQGGDLSDRNSLDFESGHALNLMTNEIRNPTNVAFIFSSSSLVEADPQFHTLVDQALAKIRTDRRVASVSTPWTEAPAIAEQHISFDHHRVWTTVGLNLAFDQARLVYPSLRDQIQSDQLTVRPNSEIAVASAFDQYSESDVSRAEAVALPLAFILLLLVFGTFVASFLCLAVGAVAVTSGIGATFLVTHFTTVSPYALNVVSLVGLGVAIDYSLFIVSRFREELRRNDDVSDALAITMATAGRAIFFSGLTVAIGLSGLIFFSGIFLVSLGFCGAIVVGLSVLYASTFLPAMLAILGRRVNKWRVPFVHQEFRNMFWIRVAQAVMRVPVLILVPVVALLLLFLSPLSKIHIVESDTQQLPAQAEARQGVEIGTHNFPGQAATQYDTVVQFDHGVPTDPANVQIASTLSERYARLTGINDVVSYVSASRGLAVTDYQRIYAQPPTAWPPALGAAVQQLTGKTIAIIDLRSPYDSQSDSADALVTKIRGASSIPGAHVYVDGATAFNKDFVGFIAGRTPMAVAFVIVVTLLVLFVFFRSVLLPIKAVIMNLISLGAALGAMVWVIQEGHLSGILNFTASPIDPTLPVLMFCLVFGLSMDYEVFLLTRIQEAYKKTGDNVYAIASGLEASARLITGAAAIMVAVFLGFALLAQEVVIKAIGLGMATAVLVDATLVRALAVPSLMQLMGRANWWAPQWALRFLNLFGRSRRQ